MINLLLFFEFCKIGLFSVGGGLATIPYIYHLSETRGWFAVDKIIDMIAVSESAPGPLGLNISTYAGHYVNGIPGGVIASLGIIFPAAVIIPIIARSFEKYKSSNYLNYLFYGIRPAVAGLIAASGLQLFNECVFDLHELILSFSFGAWIDWKKILLFAGFFVVIKKLNISPVVCVAAGAVVGIVFRV